MSDQIWNFCAQIFVEYLDDIDLNNLVEALDSRSAQNVIACWNRTRSITKRLKQESKSICNGFKPYFPRYNATGFGGYGVSDNGRAFIQCARIKQDLSTVDISEYCKALWIELLPRMSALGDWDVDTVQKIVNSFVFDPNAPIDLEALSSSRYSSDEYVCDAVCNGNAGDINIKEIAMCIHETTGKWRKTKKQSDCDQTEKMLINAFLPNLSSPWKYVLVVGQREWSDLDDIDKFICGTIDLWWFYDINGDTEAAYFCKVILLRLQRCYSDTDW